MSERKIYKKEECYKGVIIDEMYILCPHLEYSCWWRLSAKHDPKNYPYLINACYESGGLVGGLDCPKEVNLKYDPKMQDK